MGTEEPGKNRNIETYFWKLWNASWKKLKISTWEYWKSFNWLPISETTFEESGNVWNPTLKLNFRKLPKFESWGRCIDFHHYIRGLKNFRLVFEKSPNNAFFLIFFNFLLLLWFPYFFLFLNRLNNKRDLLEFNKNKKNVILIQWWLCVIV